MGYPCYLLPIHIRSSQSASTFHGRLLQLDVGPWQKGSLLGFDSYIFIQGHLVMVLVVSVVFLVLWFCVKNLGKLRCHFSFPALFYPPPCRSCLTLHPVFVFLPLFGLPWFVSATKAAYTPYTPQKAYITFYAKSGIYNKTKTKTSLWGNWPVLHRKKKICIPTKTSEMTNYDSNCRKINWREINIIVFKNPKYYLSCIACEEIICKNK